MSKKLKERLSENSIEKLFTQLICPVSDGGKVPGELLKALSRKKELKKGSPRRADGSFEPTDYSDKSNWIVLDYDNPEKKNAKADVINFYGTSVGQPDQENGVALISDEMRLIASGMYKGGADVFDDAGTRMYCPFYRQISLATALEAEWHTDLPNKIKETEVAADICAALDYYFNNFNEGRPFIIAGFSQGGASVQVALEKYFGDLRHRPLLKQMVAAYSIGYGVDKNWLNELGYLRFSEGAEDTGVVISWNTEGPDEKGTNFLLADNPADTLVINPINWKTDETYAKAEECAGSYVQGAIVQPGLYNLRYDKQRGSVICDNNTEYIALEGIDGLWGGESLHGFEISGPYLSIRQNMHKRIEAFLNK